MKDELVKGATGTSNIVGRGKVKIQIFYWNST